MSNINEWLSADVISGEGNKDVTLTADAYNGANNRTTRLAVVGRNKTKYVNIIQLKEGDVEIPTDVVNCFYVSPTTIAGTEVAIIGEGSIYYFINNEWRLIDTNTPITINKRTYFKNFNKTENSSLSLKGLCNIGGNIETLLGEMKDYYAKQAFANSDIVDASNLILPATTLGTECYTAMFYGNRYLIKTPTLSATELGRYCYQSMFEGCSSLISAPQLPASTTRGECYRYMFKDCSSLVNAPQLPATWVAQYAYEGMFRNCKSLIVAPSLPSTELTSGCYMSMFKGCSSLSTPPSLNATTLAVYCYAEMFVGCTSLISAPQLPATTLTDYCYSAMFGGCTNLENAPTLEAMELKKSCYWMMFKYCPKINYIKMLATTLYGIEGDDDFSLREWVDGVAEYGTFVKHPDMDSLTKGINGIPTLWVVEDDERYIEFSVDVDSIDLTNNSRATINVSSNTKWEVRSNSDWFSVSPMSGENNMNVIVKADFNDFEYDREGYISFLLNGDVVKTVKIYQQGNTEFLPDGVERGCFYIEPYNKGEEITIQLTRNTIINIPSNILDSYVKNNKIKYYSYENGGWDDLGWIGSIYGGTLKTKNRVYFKDFNRTYQNISYNYKTSSGAYLTITGDIYSLIYSNKPIKIGGDLSFLKCNEKKLFEGMDSLIDAYQLKLNLTKDNQYSGLFRNCRNLTSAPILPATTLYAGCYENMFENCTSLTTAPVLPATTLASNCYSGMFKGCTSLVTAPELPATELGFSCYSSMFEGCTSLVNTPQLPATTLTEYCYHKMFYNCSSLVIAPQLPATELVYYCYGYMFQGCENLRYIKMLATDLGIKYPYDDSIYYSLYGWVYDVASEGIFIKHPDMNDLPISGDGIPLGWEVRDNGDIEFTILVTEIDLINNWTSSISFISNTDWRVETSDWITLSQIEGNGNATLTITADDIYNPSQNRSGYIKFYNGNNLLGEVVVNQSLTIEFSVDVENIDMTDNLTATINVSSNTNWSVEYDSDWFSVSPINGNGDGSITITADEYNDINRSSIIYFTMNDRIVDSVRVYQISMPKNPFYIEPYNEGESISINLNISADATAYYYIEGETNDWVSLTPKKYITLPHNKKMYIKNLNYSRSFYSPFNIDGYYSVGGNIETLLGETRELYACNLFQESNIVDASNLILPATTLANSCYTYMFDSCTSLRNAPELPATTLADSCYYGMFAGCTSLVTAPALPATTLASSCYVLMFKSCTSLVNAPALPATTLASNCYKSMFNGCTKLVKAPVLPATTLAEECYTFMFYGCSNLNNITMLATDISASECLYWWVYNVSPTGIFYKNPNMDISNFSRGVSGIPLRWEVIDADI